VTQTGHEHAQTLVWNAAWVSGFK